MSSDEKGFSEFEKEMQRMGVRPMDRGAREVVKSKPVKVVPLGQEKSRGSAGGTAPQASLLASPKSVPSPESEELVRVREENQDLRGQCLELQARMEELGLEMEVLRSEALHQDAPSLQRFLQTWGVSSQAETAAWIAWLARRGELNEFFYCLELKTPARLHRVLDRSILRHCGRESCVLGEAVYSVQVPEESCEICGGRGPSDWALQLSEALMLHGHRKVLFRGVRVHLLRRLAECMDDRLEVRVVPLEVNLPFESGGGELVLLWRLGGEDSSEVDGHYRIKAASVAQFVERLGYRLQDGEA